MILKNGIAWRKGRESSLEILAQSLPSASLVTCSLWLYDFYFQPAIFGQGITSYRRVVSWSSLGLDSNQ